MAKAALNMMTRTAAQDYATDNIFMNSVDTGWITQENPFPIKERLFQEENFVPPLDEIDGMARIYDPIARGLNEVVIPLFGHFLKDFKPYFW
jgi:NAD(P)-dependent dehydrogenase (short-subunit alcohol dehydrogenase family)